eukprot:Awhi_evm1s7205
MIADQNAKEAVIDYDSPPVKNLQYYTGKVQFYSHRFRWEDAVMAFEEMKDV